MSFWRVISEAQSLRTEFLRTTRASVARVCSEAWGTGPLAPFTRSAGRGPYN